MSFPRSLVMRKLEQQTYKCDTKLQGHGVRHDAPTEREFVVQPIRVQPSLKMEVVHGIHV